MVPGNRAEVPDVIVVITDGLAQDNVKIPAEHLKSKGVKVRRYNILYAASDFDVTHQCRFESRDLNINIDYNELITFKSLNAFYKVSRILRCKIPMSFVIVTYQTCLTYIFLDVCRGRY